MPRTEDIYKVHNSIATTPIYSVSISCFHYSIIRISLNEPSLPFPQTPPKISFIYDELKTVSTLSFLRRLLAIAPTVPEFESCVADRIGKMLLAEHIVEAFKIRVVTYGCIRL